MSKKELRWTETTLEDLYFLLRENIRVESQILLPKEHGGRWSFMLAVGGLDINGDAIQSLDEAPVKFWVMLPNAGALPLLNDSPVLPPETKCRVLFTG